MDSNDDPQSDDIYPVVYQAVHDALWNVLGTAAYALILAVFFLIGLQIIIFGLFAMNAPTGIGALVLGCLLSIGSAIQFLRLFDLFPSFRSIWTSESEDR